MRVTTVDPCSHQCIFTRLWGSGGHTSGPSAGCCSSSSLGLLWRSCLSFSFCCEALRSGSRQRWIPEAPPRSPEGRRRRPGLWFMSCGTQRLFRGTNEKKFRKNIVSAHLGEPLQTSSTSSASTNWPPGSLVLQGELEEPSAWRHFREKHANELEVLMFFRLAHICSEEVKRCSMFRR